MNTKVDALDRVLERLETLRQSKLITNNEQKQIIYECEKCKDTEWITTIRDKMEFARPCECRDRKISLRLMKSSGISEDDLKKTFNDFETFNEKNLVIAKQTAAKYCKDFDDIRKTRHNSILLCGASGRGKTTLGLIIANKLISRCIGVRYMSYRDTIIRLKQVIVDEQEYNEQINRLKTAKVLFVDDLLKGKTTESDLNIIYEILNYRYLERLPIIISTEKTPKELLEFDEAVGSRILEMCRGYTVVFDKNTPNYRLRDFL